MYFDVPKVVRSPGCDHGHDEEFRNGRDVKIDILDDYIRTPEVFRRSFRLNRSAGGLPEPPGEVLGLSGPRGEREGSSQEVAHPLPGGILVGLGEGGAAPFPSPSPSLSFPPSFPSRTRKGESYSY